MANSVDPDQTPQNAASDLGLHGLLRPVCPNMWSKYGNLIKSNSLRNHPGSVPALPDQSDIGDEIFVKRDNYFRCEEEVIAKNI